MARVILPDKDKRYNILFVDDEPAFITSLKRLLRKHDDGWDIFFALSADEALAVTKENELDVIISDVQMPGKSGFDLLEILQGDPKTKEIPVIILTGNAERDLKRKALNSGAADLLNKPIDYEDLVARISSTLKLKKYQDEIRNHNLLLEEKVAERTLELQLLHQDIVWRLAKAGEYRDLETGRHILRVANYCRVLAEQKGLKKEVVELISFTSCLHDLGKIGIPDSILLKEGRLDDEEWKIMKKHSSIGAAILQEKPHDFVFYDQLQKMEVGDESRLQTDKLRTCAIEIALTHHEKWDGSGYPKGLKGEKIPLSGRITALADVYDALRAKRPYKEAFSAEVTAEIIIDGKGKHFDPVLVDIFSKNQDAFNLIHSNHI